MARRSDEDWRSLRFQAGDLFTPSSPVATAELFAGRAKQIMSLIEATAERGRHIILYGEPGVGKTSMAKILQYLIPDNLRDVYYIRRAVLSQDNYDSIWRDVFRKMSFESRDDSGDMQRHLVSDLYEGRDITPIDVVRELSQFGESVIPIVVIDEFQQLKDENSARLLSETVKAVSDEGINATIIVVGVGDSVVELVRGHSSIIRCSEEVMMPRMDKDEMKELLETRIRQLGMKIAGDAKWKIIGLSKGLPAFAHALGRSSVYSAIDRKSLTITEDDVDRGIRETINSSQQTLKDSYEDATNSNQAKATFRHLITACALSKTDASGWFTPKDISDPYSGIIGKKKGVDSFNANLKDFASEKRGNILQMKGSERNYRFRFAEPAMQPYVLMKGIEDGLLDEGAMSSLSSPEQPDLFASD